jgi:serine/threonine protein kinase
VIVDKTGDRPGYIKFVEQEREVKILQYLTGIQSPSNHTISGVQFWPVEGGTVISMPVAGGWLTSLKNRDEQLWSVALQLVEAVAFMHEHNVAHMDLKPRNVIIPPEGGRLSIIDFSVSIRVRSPDATYRGVVGTEDYIAPEVREGQYKPMLADLWSCGRTLEELCAGCYPSVDRATLLQISQQLMDRDPEARPKMSTVLEQMAPTRRGDNAVSHTTLYVEISYGSSCLQLPLQGFPGSTYNCAPPFPPLVINKSMRYPAASLQDSIPLPSCSESFVWPCVLCLSNSFQLFK